MKVRSSVKVICSKCKVVKRKGVIRGIGRAADAIVKAILVRNLAPCDSISTTAAAVTRSICRTIGTSP
jgi:ribosomal protein L36